MHFGATKVPFVAVGWISAAGPDLEKQSKTDLWGPRQSMLRWLDSGKISNLKGLIFLRSSSWMTSQKKSVRVYSTARSLSQIGLTFLGTRVFSKPVLDVSFLCLVDDEHNQSWCIAILPIGMLQDRVNTIQKLLTLLVSTAVWQLKVKLSLCSSRQWWNKRKNIGFIGCRSMFTSWVVTNQKMWPARTRRRWSRYRSRSW